MTILNSVGKEIPWLPDTAFCWLAQHHPCTMEKCPIRKFDSEGEICVPNLCREYVEGSKLS